MDPRFLTLVFLGLAIPDVSSPPEDCLKPPFRGITERSPLGELTGKVDHRDWGCADPSNFRPESATDVPPPPVSDPCLHQAYPNPAEDLVTINFGIAASGNVQLTIYGQTHGHGRPEAFPVRVLVSSALVSGLHAVVWDLLDEDGKQVEPGIYRAVLTAQGRVFCGDIEVR